MRRLTIVLLMALPVVSCHYDPFAHEFTEVKPNASDLVGTYVLDSESIAMLDRHYQVPPPGSRFILRGDGTFTIQNVPSCWRAAAECSRQTETADGQWEIGKEQRQWWAVQLSCANISGNKTDYGVPAMIRGDHPPLLLHFTVGDPDTGEGLAFRKEPT
jgi:hypothetical protein